MTFFLQILTNFFAELTTALHMLSLVQTEWFHWSYMNAGNQSYRDGPCGHKLLTQFAAPAGNPAQPLLRLG